ncbi:hypothetical protein CP556_00280 [Natrinema sp. CBA1119]|uniref:hypothetical protein n=1 Tax=Natrinema sp. CBA1119 TaxID=1608465 RepID=UPI000BF8CBC0|nr:hypothetical protein [Natrinema sp. CBA1119]PGF14704.1 hypothetical protein CP556_00280 [Natrinema sp. CBA1119]
MTEILSVIDLVSFISAIAGIIVVLGTIRTIIRPNGRIRNDAGKRYALTLFVLGMASILLLYSFLLTRTAIILPDIGGIIASIPLPALAGLIAICIGQIQKLDRAHCPGCA